MRYSLLRSKQEVLGLSRDARQLAERVLGAAELTGLVEYFLARLGSGNRPAVVTCRDDAQALTGILYAEEWQLCGMGTGWVFGGDDMGRGLILASDGQQADLLAAMSRVLVESGMHALRLRWRAPSGMAVPQAIESPGVQMADSIDYRPEGDWLHLPGSYEEFLAALGPHTRRNLRYYRRKAESEGIRFVSGLSPEVYEGAVDCLRDLADFPHDREREERDLRFFATLGPPLLIGLRRSDGAFVSVLSAVAHGSTLHVLSQLNDESLRRMSISVVLRAYLLEDAIARGFRAVHFINGTSPMLGRYCPPVLIRTISVDCSRSLLHPVKLAAGRLARRRQRRARWVPIRLRTLLGQNFLDEKAEGQSTPLDVSS